ncbi:hypothetical protein [Stenotrophomonas maltophilia]|uniref:hypothetical protein n=1 Tax=Stenotrophomonas maltophilia TaxID=40324 RepID=UPI000DA72903|nr:hypothetical protein [Stenotrophomonas maltophilia]PZT05464.1 hypothetical protein A7X91_01820 [Stenotrophomonas maltophilia]
MASRLYWIKDCYINLDHITFLPRIGHDEDLDVEGEENPVSGYVLRVYTAGREHPHSFVFETEAEATAERNSLVAAAGVAPRR